MRAVCMWPHMPTSTTYFDHMDWMRTERVRSDVNGESFETCTCLPYGDAQSCLDPQDASPLHFTGKIWDTETGLDNFPEPPVNRRVVGSSPT